MSQSTEFPSEGAILHHFKGLASASEPLPDASFLMFSYRRCMPICSPAFIFTHRSSEASKSLLPFRVSSSTALHSTPPPLRPPPTPTRALSVWAMAALMFPNSDAVNNTRLRVERSWMNAPTWPRHRVCVYSLNGVFQTRSRWRGLRFTRGNQCDIARSHCAQQSRKTTNLAGKCSLCDANDAAKDCDAPETRFPSSCALFKTQPQPGLYLPFNLQLQRDCSQTPTHLH